jgi:hypothetical protein
MYGRFAFCGCSWWRKQEGFGLGGWGWRFGWGPGRTWPTGDGPLAEAVHGWEGDRDAVLVEPLGDLAVSLLLGPQRHDGPAVFFELAAGAALGFGFGGFLQFHGRLS